MVTSLFLCGDVMTGRAIDQILPHPGNPVLYESYIRDARDYVALAEAVNGPIPRPVGVEYMWGEALEELRRSEIDFRIINLETSITTSDKPWPNKGVHYRMNPANVDCLTAAHIDCCSLANNHTLDWEYRGLLETLATLDRIGVARAGAGLNWTEAAAPAVLEVSGHGRVLVFALGSPDSGIPLSWSATENRPGLNMIDDFSEDTVRRIAGQVRRLKQYGDTAIASIHWGGNWGFPIPDEHVKFAHRLVEEGIDVIHGHSSHHVKSIEVYRNRPILYGCGDFLNDYEGIQGFEEFRSDLTLMYFLRHDERGQLLEMRLVPMQVRRFRLDRPSVEDSRWLGDLVSHLGAPFGTEVRMTDDNSMTLEWR